MPECSHGNRSEQEQYIDESQDFFNLLRAKPVKIINNVSERQYTTRYPENMRFSQKDKDIDTNKHVIQDTNCFIIKNDAYGSRTGTVLSSAYNKDAIQFKKEQCNPTMTYHSPVLKHITSLPSVLKKTERPILYEHPHERHAKSLDNYVDDSISTMSYNDNTYCPQQRISIPLSRVSKKEKVYKTDNHIPKRTTTNVNNVILVSNTLDMTKNSNLQWNQHYPTASSTSGYLLQQQDMSHGSIHKRCHKDSQRVYKHCTVLDSSNEEVTTYPYHCHIHKSSRSLDHTHPLEENQYTSIDHLNFSRLSDSSLSSHIEEVPTPDQEFIHITQQQKSISPVSCQPPYDKSVLKHTSYKTYSKQQQDLSLFSNPDNVLIPSSSFSNKSLIPSSEHIQTRYSCIPMESIIYHDHLSTTPSIRCDASLSSKVPRHHYTSMSNTHQPIIQQTQPCQHILPINDSCYLASHYSRSTHKCVKDSMSQYSPIHKKTIEAFSRHSTSLHKKHSSQKKHKQMINSVPCQLATLSTALALRHFSWAWDIPTKNHSFPQLIIRLVLKDAMSVWKHQHIQHRIRTMIQDNERQQNNSIENFQKQLEIKDLLCETLRQEISSNLIISNQEKKELIKTYEQMISDLKTDHTHNIIQQENVIQQLNEMQQTLQNERSHVHQEFTMMSQKYSEVSEQATRYKDDCWALQRHLLTKKERISQLYECIEMGHEDSTHSQCDLEKRIKQLELTLKDKRLTIDHLRISLQTTIHNETKVVEELELAHDTITDLKNKIAAKVPESRLEELKDMNKEQTMVLTKTKNQLSALQAECTQRILEQETLMRDIQDNYAKLLAENIGYKTSDKKNVELLHQLKEDFDQCQNLLISSKSDYEKEIVLLKSEFAQLKKRYTEQTEETLLLKKKCQLYEQDQIVLMHQTRCKELSIKPKNLSKLDIQETSISQSNPLSYDKLLSPLQVEFESNQIEELSDMSHYSVIQMSSDSSHEMSRTNIEPPQSSHNTQHSSYITPHHFKTLTPRFGKHMIPHTDTPQQQSVVSNDVVSFNVQQSKEEQKKLSPTSQTDSVVSKTFDLNLSTTPFNDLEPTLSGHTESCSLLTTESSELSEQSCFKGYMDDHPHIESYSMKTLESPKSDLQDHTIDMISQHSHDVSEEIIHNDYRPHQEPKKKSIGLNNKFMNRFLLTKRLKHTKKKSYHTRIEQQTLQHNQIETYPTKHMIEDMLVNYRELLVQYSSQCRLAYAELQSQTTRFESLMGQLKSINLLNATDHDQTVADSLRQDLSACRWIIESAHSAREVAAKRRFELLLDIERLEDQKKDCQSFE